MQSENFVGVITVVSVFFFGCHEKMVDGKNFFWVSKLADTKKIWVSKMVDTNINWYRNRYRYRPIPMSNVLVTKNVDLVT